MLTLFIMGVTANKNHSLVCIWGVKTLVYFFWSALIMKNKYMCVCEFKKEFKYLKILNIFKC